MRRAQKGSFLLNDSGEVCAINLGADYCAEHEWGIKGIQHSFSIRSDDTSIVGIERRRVNQVPEKLKLLKLKDCWILSLGEPSMSELHAHSEKEDFYAAWSERSFAICVYNDAPNSENSKKVLEDFHQAFQDKRIAIWVGGGQVFQNGGLIISIIDRCPESGLKKMKEADLENNRLKEADERIDKGLNLRGRLRAAKKDWFALSPRFHYGHDDDKTAFEIIYWLNPCDQRRNRYGWVTVEDLIAWSKDTGPIIVTEKTKDQFAGVVVSHAQKGCFGKV